MATKEIDGAQTTVSKSKQGEFKPIIGTTGSSLHVLETKANHSNSMKLLDEAGLRPLTRQEILPLLMKDETLKDSLKGKWFYLAGEGLKEDGIYTVDAKGDLAKIEDKNLSIENKVLVYSGSNPLSLVVNSDDGTAYYGRRFGLVADFGPRNVAPVVVGVLKERSEQSQAETINIRKD